MSATDPERFAAPHPTNTTRRPGMGIPERASLDGLEERWTKRWDEEGTYDFDATRDRQSVYSIDTPPPTVSGSLHVGHVFSYTQTDVVARYNRMRGKAVFYPIGFDDNGLPTERRVQHYFGVRCDPTKAYEPDLVPPRDAGQVTGPATGQAPQHAPAGGPGRSGKHQVGAAKGDLAISRPNFVELCRRLSVEDEVVFEQLFRRLAVSVDWSLRYTTIGKRAQRTSQRAFLHLVSKNEAYRQQAPTLWDVDFSSAIAQAELEDREVAGAYVRLAFPRSDGKGPPVVIATTRPELLASCVALVAHPEDDRYASLVGGTVKTPLFKIEVPVLAHSLADPSKGTGIAMVCTFGDTTDVVWWRDLALPSRTLVGRDGRLEHADFASEEFPSSDPISARRAYDELEGRSVSAARRRIIELLAVAGALVGEPEPVTHAVKFYERGERPLEIVSSRQWYIRTLAHRDELLEAGRQLAWHPGFMRARFESWVEGLASDWNISRQRYFGVPFPVWYPLGPDGTPDEEHPILAPEQDLPVDPSVDVPPGYGAAQRGEPGGFIADPDVMDTWATSSLTPQIAGRWGDDDDLFARVFPMDLRPQAHEIIRTWLFATVTRSLLEHSALPFKNASISGWILDKDHKKISKSKGNAVVPTDFLETHGTDAVRYWAGAARLGVDTAFDEQQMRIGRRLALKILNASRFVLSRLSATGQSELAWFADGSRELEPLDAAMLTELSDVVARATEDFERYEHARALERTERFFWSFCDDYLELVKGRAYVTDDTRGAASARYSLETALSVLLRLFAPFLPFATEEAWSWWHDSSIHLAAWPSVGELGAARSSEARSSETGQGATEDAGDVERAGEGKITDEPALLGLLAWVLGEVRRAKSEAKSSMRAPVNRVVVSADPTTLKLIGLARDDLLAAGGIAELVLEESRAGTSVEVSLAPAHRA